ncbi:nucleotidyl cyclase domain-containing protein [Streptomyces marincola]|uniref:hypothetical protein n=1 Tax=Streptomyces marincola TaxID=2878388 RepID=UPI001CF3D176|nr:hypothetical protein [Streptomyces marincola]UCM91261.1 hypothetical protein LC193_26790 [Streptomyces marincola]
MSGVDSVTAELAYRAVLAVDIERSAGRGNTAFFAARGALVAALRGAFEETGIAWEACLHDDLGDGFRVTTPAGTPKARLLHPLVPELSARLRAHNRGAAPGARVRVRVALHAGDVRLGRGGTATGRPMEVLARLLDAEPARAALAQAPPSVVAAVLVSGHFHDETVCHGYPGIEPELFQRIVFTAKEFAAESWLHLAGHPAPPPWPGTGAHTQPQPPDERGASSGPTRPTDSGPDAGRAGGAVSRMSNTAKGHGVVFATQNGSQHIHQHNGGS